MRVKVVTEIQEQKTLLPHLLVMLWVVKAKSPCESGFNVH